MATMVLTTLGKAVAGPVGAALGGLAGRAIDGAVFGTRARQGPRLTELQVQLSSYGTQIPKLFGRMRVAGTVIWATDLREAATTTGGKSTGKTTRYSYSASFAVALSGRPIRGIRRIWAEGKLLRGAAGDWKTRTAFRWYPGDEAQMPDPLIASIVGAGNAPAYRGIAYAVFEDLALADFGNRIPSLSFEVEADAGPVAAGTIVEALGAGAIVADAGGPLLGGYAASGAARRDAIEGLVEPLGGWYATQGDRVALRSGIGPARRLSDAVLQGDAPDWQRPPAMPADVAIAYHDIARDYQAGVQQVLRGGPARRMLRIELPAAMTAEVAMEIAGDVAARAALAGEQRTVVLDWRAIDVAPGERVTLSDADGLWRVRRTRIEAMRITLELVRIAVATLPAPAAVGAPQLAADVATGETRLMLVELPSDSGGGAPWIGAIAAGTASGWRRATLLVGDDGRGWSEVGATAVPGVLGQVTLPPGSGSAMIEDRAGVIEVELLHDAMTLETIDDAALDRGGNAALVGTEIVQFGRAQRIGPARWRLSRLWRGRRGSGMAGHQTGEDFALLDPATIRRIESPGPIGQALAVMAAGIVEGDKVTAAIVPRGWAMVPPAPVHVSIGHDGDRVELRWVRRCRLSAPWRDAIDTPLGEEREAYRLTLTDAQGNVRTIEVAEPRWPIAPAGGALTIELRQIGTYGASAPALFHYRPEMTR